MDVMLQKRCAKFIYVIPEGLRELMSDISREVIRSQPEDMYTFIADYLDALMITRENARVASRLVESIIRIGVTTVELLERTGMTREEADRLATIIQYAFRQYMASKKLTVTVCDDASEVEEEQEMVSNILEQYGEIVDNENTAAEIIQRAFKAFKERHKKESEMLTGMIDWRVAARSAIYLYRKSGVTYEEANRAATLIKAAYKGYYTRRIMKRLESEGKMFYEEEDKSACEEEEKPQGEEFLEIEGETAFESDVAAGEPSDWKDYLPSEEPDGEGSPTSEYEVTSTEVADSIMDSVLKMIPSESEIISETPRDWIEGLEAGQADAEGYETGGTTAVESSQEMAQTEEEQTIPSPTGEPDQQEIIDEVNPESAPTDTEMSQFEEGAGPEYQEGVTEVELIAEDETVEEG